MLKWDAPLEAIRDGRSQGRIPTSVVVRAVLAMCFCRLGKPPTYRRCHGPTQSLPQTSPKSPSEADTPAQTL
ncbi:MAG: hypothetical protein WC869_03060 [Phycisphaerae bacterium]